MILFTFMNVERRKLPWPAKVVLATSVPFLALTYSAYRSFTSYEELNNDPLVSRGLKFDNADRSLRSAQAELSVKKDVTLLPQLVGDNLPFFVPLESRQHDNPRINEAKRKVDKAAQAFRPVAGSEGEISQNISELKQELDENRFQPEKVKTIRENILKTAEHKAYARAEGKQLLWGMAGFFSLVATGASVLATWPISSVRKKA